MKQLRQSAIRDLVRQRPIRTQHDLAAALRERGFRATQATISRDVAELGLEKVDRDGVFVYAPVPRAAEAEPSAEERLARLLADLPVDIEPAGLLLVIRTLPGSAHAIASWIDRARWKDVRRHGRRGRHALRRVPAGNGRRRLCGWPAGSRPAALAVSPGGGSPRRWQPGLHPAEPIRQPAAVAAAADPLAVAARVRSPQRSHVQIADPCCARGNRARRVLPAPSGYARHPPRGSRRHCARVTSMWRRDPPLATRRPAAPRTAGSNGPCLWAVLTHPCLGPKIRRQTDSQRGLAAPGGCFF